MSTDPKEIWALFQVVNLLAPWPDLKALHDEAKAEYDKRIVEKSGD